MPQQEPELRQLAVAAAREFNAGRYFEAHEVIEEGLEQVPDALWELFVGLIQIAVGYHKVTQALWDGATRMLSLGLNKLTPFAPDAGGIDVEAMRQRVTADLEKLRDGRIDVPEFNRQPPRLRMRN